MKFCSNCGLEIKSAHIINNNEWNNPGMEGSFCLCVSGEKLILCGPSSLYDKYNKYHELLSSITCWNDPVLHETHMELHSNNRPNYIPAPALSLKYRTINCEYLWSAFLTSVSHLVLMEKYGFQMEKITGDHIFLLKNFSLSGISPAVFVPIFSEKSVSNQENLTALSEVFASLSPLFTGDRYEDSFIYILNKARKTELLEFYNFISNIKRLHTFHPEVVTQKIQKNYLKNAILWVLPLLFIISLGISWFSGSKSSKEDVKKINEKILEEPPAVKEIVVSSNQVRWDKEFYFNRIDLKSDSYLFLNRKLEQDCFPGLIETYLQQLRLPTVNCDKHTECIYESSFSKKTWKSKLTRFSVLEGKIWKVISGKKLSQNALADGAPSGDFGNILNLINYNTLSHNDDILIMYSRMPDKIPPQDTIISPILGGILPQIIASRVYVNGEKIFIKTAAKFNSDADARASLTNAMTYIKAFFPEKSIISAVSGKTVVVSVVLSSRCVLPKR